MKKLYKNIIVTGGAGFIGSHLVDQLVGISKKVIVIDKVKPEKGRKNRKAKYLKMNIQDSGALDVFKKYEPEVVFHLAAHLHDRESVEMPIDNAMDNVIGLLNICEANRKTSKAKMVFMSSCAVYGMHEELPITEEFTPNPLTPYGISKLVGENYLRFYNKTYGIPYTAFRAGNIYGPRQDSSAESGVIGIFSSRLICGKQVMINNDGKTTRDYVFVDDVVRALLSAADSEFVGVLNIGTGAETETGDIFKQVKAAVGVGVSAERNEMQQDALKNIALDVSAAREALNWEPSVTIDEGIEKTVQWYRENI
ncbi:NAD-dependent epimerase/dehydratase family protein [Candidatus Uhrbacteria bacterium]|nr:NAD-dependent epimerase/dehydratase family protein [Candidatus Uhrbacteria bacterium]MBT7716893.1 NAD-dependent epimerase/dehydratase family protein [Candidatus Uhrbacteria bacterium]